MTLWLHGPSIATVDHSIVSEETTVPPIECLTEMKAKKGKLATMLVNHAYAPAVLPCEDTTAVSRD